MKLIIYIIDDNTPEMKAMAANIRKGFKYCQEDDQEIEKYEADVFELDSFENIDAVVREHDMPDIIMTDYNLKVGSSEDGLSYTEKNIGLIRCGDTVIDENVKIIVYSGFKGIGPQNIQQLYALHVDNFFDREEVVRGEDLFNFIKETLFRGRDENLLRALDSMIDEDEDDEIEVFSASANSSDVHVLTIEEIRKNVLLQTSKSKSFRESMDRVILRAIGVSK